MKTNTRKKQQFEFFSLAKRTRSPEKNREQWLKEKRWFSVHHIQESN
ncbi:MAG: hypothetical protein AAGC43_02000 [Bacteroidota bacterium]